PDDVPLRRRHPGADHAAGDAPGERAAAAHPCRPAAAGPVVRRAVERPPAAGGGARRHAAGRRRDLGADVPLGVTMLGPLLTLARAAAPSTAMVVSGIVRDSMGLPVPQVSVYVAGSQELATTDAQGRFEL